MKKKFLRGFSLVELLVVISIFLLITGVVVFNQNKFSSNSSVTNVAYEVALQVRQAQVYGILAKDDYQFDEFDNQDPRAFGVHLEKVNGNDIGLIFFQDGDGSGGVGSDDLMYVDSEDTLLNQFVLVEGNRINDVCTYDGAGDERCINAGDDNIDHVDISFLRPEPRAVITDSESDDQLDSRDEVRITIISSLNDRERIVKVLSSGQISVATP